MGPDSMMASGAVGQETFPEVEDRLREFDGVVGHAVTDGLVRVFLVQVPLALGACQEAIAQGDPRGLRDSAHKAMSAFSQFGTKEFVERCRVLEELGASGSVDGAGRLLTELLACYGALRRYHERWLATSPAAR